MITTDEYNRLASPTSRIRDPVFEIGYIPGDLRGDRYDKVNLFLEKTTCVSYMPFMVTEGIVPACTKYILLEISVQNKRLFNHVGAHGSGFFNRVGVSTTWAIHTGSTYILDTMEKSLHKVSYMNLSNGVGGLLTALSWQNGYGWDFWCVRKVKEELPSLLEYIATHHEAKIQEQKIYFCTGTS